MRTIDFTRLDVQQNHRVLDLGCGRGRHTQALATHGIRHAVALDLSFEDVRASRDNLIAPETTKTSFSVGDALRLPFANESFDRIICSEVLEHIIDYQTVIGEIWRILRKGGRIGISVPRTIPEYICWLLSQSYHNTPGGHVRIFKRQQLIDAFQTQGFQYLTRHYAHGLHSPYWWLRCAAGVNRPDTHLARWYHAMLVYEMMHNPLALRPISRAADWLMGKSLVVYFDKA